VILAACGANRGYQCSRKYHIAELVSIDKVLRKSVFSHSVYHML